MTIMVTGGAGFIGSAVIRHLLKNTNHRVVNVDKLTYAANLLSLDSVSSSPNYILEKVDICDTNKIRKLFQKYKPQAVMHLAAESHVDRSIDGPKDFIQTNVFGTFNLLEASREYWQTLEAGKKNDFKFHHVSTDEVYGDLGTDGGYFEESTAYDPSSPYSASKAASDHLVRAWHRTYGLPVLVTNCSNNYGPYHFPEKLIPLMILNAIHGKALPVYGKGEQVRDWLYVEDHANALCHVLESGEPGETYNIGGNCEVKNIDVVHTICDLLEEMRRNKPAGVNMYSDLIAYVSDRPGHDYRYAINANKIKTKLNWEPEETFESGLRKTIGWYLDNPSWWQPIWGSKYSGERLGNA